MQRPCSLIQSAVGSKELEIRCGYILIAGWAAILPAMIGLYSMPAFVKWFSSWSRSFPEFSFKTTDNQNHACVVQFGSGFCMETSVVKPWRTDCIFNALSARFLLISGIFGISEIPNAACRSVDLKLNPKSTNLNDVFWGSSFKPMTMRSQLQFSCVSHFIFMIRLL